jgi:hypothetical protein
VLPDEEALDVLIKPFFFRVYKALSYELGIWD